MQVEKEILVRYGEIFLKSEMVRRIYEKKLVENIKASLKKSSLEFEIYRTRGRIFIKTENLKKACKTLKKIFGIVSFSPCFHLKTSKKEEIVKFFEENYEQFVKPKQTFALEIKRIGKHDYSSMELAKDVGKVIKRKVNLSKPQVKIFVEVRENDTYVYTKKIKGLGGMPVSSSGKVLSLISGGIDSPVSSWLAMKRGCKVIFIHFHSFPLVSKTSIEKTRELIKILSQYQGKSRVYFIPFSEIQMKIKTLASAKYRIVLYRRVMLKIAEEIAKKENAKALVTGESLAQVSSQTLDNILAIEEATTLPILRPLVGMDKNEIIELAKKIKTYEISIKPQEDCCTLFVPKHPTTRAKLEIIKRIEKKLKLEKEIDNVIKKAEVEEIG
ncbi:MAG: tRNA 4-thiouridine(8) synthase ThiI [Candidatus Aenigmarchaeota archaeon]|nr:tRNA 4-thiouridine(8) synthase ThiI [Candidatus Aenigmarchaeota archaeon]